MTPWLIPFLLLQATPEAGQPLAAVVRWEAALAADPANPEPVYQLGRAYERVAQWAVQRIRDRNPDAARLHQWIGEGLARQGQREAAIAAYQKAVAADPKLPGSHLALAVLWLQAGDRAKALAALDAEAALSPESVAVARLRSALR